MGSHHTSHTTHPTTPLQHSSNQPLGEFESSTRRPNDSSSTFLPPAVMFRCGSSSRIDSANAFTILFEVPAANATTDAGMEEATNNDPFTYYSSSSSSSCSSPVDCTLSLGSASTRQSKSPTNTTKNSNGSTCIPNTIYWDILSQAKQMRSPASSRATAYDAAPGADGDSLLSRRCANCDTTSTPLWRNGPRGPKSLCNACGIRYKKEERRAAAAATFTSPSLSPMQPPIVIDSQHRNGTNYGYNHSHPWAHAPVTASRMRSGATSISMSSSSGRLSDDNDGENSGMPFYSWCLDAPTPSRPKFLHP